LDEVLRTDVAKKKPFSSGMLLQKDFFLERQPDWLGAYRELAKEVQSNSTAQLFEV